MGGLKPGHQAVSAPYPYGVAAEIMPSNASIRRRWCFC